MGKGISDKVLSMRRNDLLQREKKRREKSYEKMTDEENQKSIINIIKGNIINLEYDLKQIDSDPIRYKLKLTKEKLIIEEEKLKQMIKIKNDKNKK